MNESEFGESELATFEEQLRQCRPRDEVPSQAVRFFEAGRQSAKHQKGRRLSAVMSHAVCGALCAAASVLIVMQFPDRLGSAHGIAKGTSPTQVTPSTVFPNFPANGLPRSDSQVKHSWVESAGATLTIAGTYRLDNSLPSRLTSSEPNLSTGEVFSESTARSLTSMAMLHEYLETMQ